VDEKLLEIFAEEAREIMDSLEEGLLSLEGSPDPETINNVFRAAHTMKGNAGIVGYDDVVELTHLMEGVLDQMRQGARQPDSGLVSLLLKATDSLKGMVEARLAGRTPQAPQEVLEALTPLLEAEASPPPAAAPPPMAATASEPKPSLPEAQRRERRRLYILIKLQPDLFTTGADPLQLLRELEELGELERVVCHVEDLPPFAEMDPFTLYLWWEVWLKTSHPLGTVENVFMFVRDEGEISIQESRDRPPAEPPAPAPRPMPQAARPKVGQPPAPAPASAAATPARAVPVAPPTIRVDTNKLDKLVNLVGEMVIGVARVSESIGERRTPELQSALESMGHISRDLQQQVMQVRMVPVEGTFNRFRRMVRDLAAEQGKEIRLELSGIDTELDKNVAELIADPLKHLVRNAADHGLEPPAQRRQAGKPAEGTIWLRAYQQGGRIFIEVADDGRGIDAERVLAKAVSLGLVPPEARPTPQEIYELLFHPGFSTAREVTELSGRGVGLDVVRENIEALRGSVEVNSTLGRGATFRINLPLTLAIIDGMNVQVASEVFVLPLLSIVESLKPRPEQLKTVEGQGELLRLRDSYIPLVRLARLFELPGGVEDPSLGLVVVIESLGKRFGLLVDDILGEQQAVIKSLEQNYQKVPGVSGATIMGDGRVGLILDILGLEKMALGRGGE
jgi:two-component system chemotaxis sensor kinase CheA